MPAMKPVTDPIFEKQWHLKMLNVEAAWKHATGKGVKVGLIDSGIDYTHRDLGGEGGMDITANDSKREREQKTAAALNLIRSGKHPKILGGYNFVNGNGGDDIWDSHRHGTAMAGLICAERDGYGMVGIAYEAKLYVYCVLGKFGTGNQTDFAEALCRAREDGCDIVNMSLAYRRALQNDVIDQVQKCCDSGMVMVAATGNWNESKIAGPSYLSGVIAVGGCDARGIRWKHNSRWGSNYGTGLDCVCPASAQYTTYLMRSRHDQISATSAACANMTGILALALSVNKGIPTDILRELLTESCSEDSWNSETGYGYPDAAKLVSKCMTAEESERDEVGIELDKIRTSLDRIYEIRSST